MEYIATVSSLDWHYVFTERSRSKHLIVIWLLSTMTTSDTSEIMYVHPFVDCTVSLTLLVTRIPPARYYDELSSEIRPQNMASSMW